MYDQKPTQFPAKSDIATMALPKSAIARFGRGCEAQMAFSPDGQYLAVGTWVGLWLYELATMTVSALWETERGMIGTLTFSPNGEWIAFSNSDNVIKVWDIQRSSCVTQIALDASISRLTFSSDSRWLAASYVCSSYVECWDPIIGTSFAKFAGKSEKGSFIRPIVLSPDNRFVASTSHTNVDTRGDSVVVWDIEQGEQIACLTGHTAHLYSLCFSPCGQFLTSGGGADGTVRVWHTGKWQQIQEHTSCGTSRMIPSYSPEGTLRTTVMSYDTATVTVYDTENSRQLYTAKVPGSTTEFSDPDDWGNTIEFSNGSQLAYESRPASINIWSLGNPRAHTLTCAPISYPESLIFLTDGKTLAAEYLHEGVLLWDITYKRLYPAIEVQSAGKNQFVYLSTFGKLHVASLNGNTVTLWEVGSGGHPIAEYIGHAYKSVRPALSPTGKQLACALDDGTLSVWDVPNGAKVQEFRHTLKDDSDWIGTLAFNLDGRLLASQSSSGLHVRLWNVEFGKEVDEFPSDETSMFRDFSPCGRYVACGYEDILLWDIAQRSIHSVLQRPRTYAFTFSPCSKYVAYGNDEEIFLWDLIHCDNFMRIHLPPEWETYTLAFSPNGRYIAAGAWWIAGWNKVPICLWEVATGENIATFWGHPTDVQTLVFSPDSTYLASGSYDGTILLWNMKPYL